EASGRPKSHPNELLEEVQTTNATLSELHGQVRRIERRFPAVELAGAGSIARLKHLETRLARVEALISNNARRIESSVAKRTDWLSAKVGKVLDRLEGPDTTDRKRTMTKRKSPVANAPKTEPSRERSTV